MCGDWRPGRAGGVLLARNRLGRRWPAVLGLRRACCSWLISPRQNPGNWVCSTNITRTSDTHYGTHCEPCVKWRSPLLDHRVLSDSSATMTNRLDIVEFNGYVMIVQKCMYGSNPRLPLSTMLFKVCCFVLRQTIGIPQHTPLSTQSHPFKHESHTTRLPCYHWT